MSWTSETAIAVTLNPPGNTAMPPSLTTQVRELVKASTDAQPITSVDQVRKLLGCRKQELSDAFHWLDKTGQITKRSGRFEWLSDVAGKPLVEDGSE